ncbi:MAG: adenylyl-sulfate kinase [Rhodocyclaceae bacterium]|jgi:adenylylsulfate kinase|nr:adenylyl-sulfate kinase [Rhodocyclaceae bacterium]
MREIVWHEASVSRARREAQQEHRSILLWFTGLSGAGKSTIAHAVEETLHARGARTFVLDGDNVRHGLCGDLGFSMADREENIRRIGEVTKLFLQAGIITLTAFISPLRASREQVRELVGARDFLEIYCQCPLEVCEQRDVKGLYRRARSGEIRHFTGISSPYEPPQAPELVLDTGALSIDESAAAVLDLLARRGVLA